MDHSAFMEKNVRPREADLIGVLGRARKLWDELRELVASDFTSLDEEWVYSGKNYGWSLRLKQKKRAILYMTPLEKYFRVSFAFGEKAVVAAHQSKLPSTLLKIIDEAPRYPEGRALRLEIRKKTDVRFAVMLAGIKMSN